MMGSDRGASSTSGRGSPSRRSRGRSPRAAARGSPSSRSAVAQEGMYRATGAEHYAQWSIDYQRHNMQHPPHMGSFPPPHYGSMLLTGSSSDLQQHPLMLPAQRVGGPEIEHRRASRGVRRRVQQPQSGEFPAQSHRVTSEYSGSRGGEKGGQMLDILHRRGGSLPDYSMGAVRRDVAARLGLSPPVRRALGPTSISVDSPTRGTIFRFDYDYRDPAASSPSEASAGSPATASTTSGDEEGSRGAHALTPEVFHPQQQLQHPHRDSSLSPCDHGNGNAEQRRRAYSETTILAYRTSQLQATDTAVEEDTNPVAVFDPIGIITDPNIARFLWPPATTPPPPPQQLSPADPVSNPAPSGGASPSSSSSEMPTEVVTRVPTSALTTPTPTRSGSPTGSDANNGGISPAKRGCRITLTSPEVAGETQPEVKVDTPVTEPEAPHKTGQSLVSQEVLGKRVKLKRFLHDRYQREKGPRHASEGDNTPKDLAPPPAVRSSSTSALPEQSSDEPVAIYQPILTPSCSKFPMRESSPSKRKHESPQSASPEEEDTNKCASLARAAGLAHPEVAQIPSSRSHAQPELARTSSAHHSHAPPLAELQGHRNVQSCELTPRPALEKQFSIKTEPVSDEEPDTPHSVFLSPRPWASPGAARGRATEVTSPYFFGHDASSYHYHSPGSTLSSERRSSSRSSSDQGSMDTAISRSGSEVRDPDNLEQQQQLIQQHQQHLQQQQQRLHHIQQLQHFHQQQQQQQQAVVDVVVHQEQLDARVLMDSFYEQQRLQRQRMALIGGPGGPGHIQPLQPQQQHFVAPLRSSSPLQQRDSVYQQQRQSTRASSTATSGVAPPVVEQTVLTRQQLRTHSRIPEERKTERSSAELVAQTNAYVCPICGQAFPTYDNLGKHMINHYPSEIVDKGDGKVVHVCKVCERSFSRSDMLTRHMRLHTGIKPYQCNVCNQVFSRSDHLHTHLRTHTGEKPYKCPTCPYAAPRRDMITRHMRIHYKQWPRRGRRSSSSTASGSSTASEPVEAPAQQSTESFETRKSSASSLEFSSFEGGSSEMRTGRNWSVTSGESAESSEDVGLPRRLSSTDSLPSTSSSARGRAPWLWSSSSLSTESDALPSPKRTRMWSQSSSSSSSGDVRRHSRSWSLASIESLDTEESAVNQGGAPSGAGQSASRVSLALSGSQSSRGSELSPVKEGPGESESPLLEQQQQHLQHRAFQRPAGYHHRQSANRRPPPVSANQTRAVQAANQQAALYHPPQQRLEVVNEENGNNSGSNGGASKEHGK